MTTISRKAISLRTPTRASQRLALDDQNDGNELLLITEGGNGREPTYREIAKVNDPDAVKKVPIELRESFFELLQKWEEERDAILSEMRQAREHEIEDYEDYIDGANATYYGNLGV